MINLTNLTQTIASQLNGLDTGLTFALFTDIGEVKKAYKPQRSNTVVHYVNGVLNVLTPQINPIKNLQAITLSLSITCLVDIDLDGKNTDGEYTQEIAVRSALSQYISQYNGIPTSYTDTDGVVFTVVPAFDGITVGTAQQISPLGNTLPIILTGTFTFIENGINTNSVDIYINGENIYFDELAITRNRTKEESVFAGNDVTKAIIQANGLGLGLTLPLLNTTEMLAIEDDILDGGNNNAQMVQYVRGTKVKNYIMVFGTNSGSFLPAKNVGLGVSLYEGRRELLTYSDNWKIYTYTVEAGDIVRFSTPSTNIYGVIFWGDDTSDVLTINGIEHTYTEAGTYVAYLFIADSSINTLKFSGLNSSGNITTVVEDIVAYAVTGANLGTSFIVPSTYLTKPVIMIWNSAFLDTDDKLNINSITFGSNLTTIKQRAFEGSDFMQVELVFPSSLTKIEWQAFYLATGLTGALIIPANVTEIGDSAFTNCQFNGNLTLPSGLLTIGEDAFLSCSYFTGDLTIPSTVTSIGDRAFLSTPFHTVKVLATIPPTLGGTDVFDSVGVTRIEVPSASLSVYQTAWSVYYDLLVGV